jgi:hypothetical protein
MRQTASSSLLDNLVGLGPSTEEAKLDQIKNPATAGTVVLSARGAELPERHPLPELSG